MLLLKSNPELRKVFERLIKTMKLPVTWTGIFVITNNNLILAGEIRSLVFSFDTKRAYTNIIEIPTESEQLESMPNDALLNNVMNMTLYAFGKWGIINGLTVEKDYQTLNNLFGNVLRAVKIEPDFRAENFRFFKDGMQITYEDTLLALLRLLKNEGKLNEGQSLVTSELQANKLKNAQKENTSNSKNAEAKKGNEIEDEDDDYEIGLWHNMRWNTKTCSFKKCSQNEEDAIRIRIGNNFYLANYLCPKCGEKLYLGVYPANKELLIDTEEGRVFMARTYACHNCSTFYTPQPRKLLQEGDVYSLSFDNDRTAYEDYLEILGRKAERTTNYNFNEFEADRNRKHKNEPDEEYDNKQDAESVPSSVTGIRGLKEQIFKGGEKLFSKNRKKQHAETQSMPESKNPTEGIPETEKPNIQENEIQGTKTKNTQNSNRLSEKTANTTNLERREPEEPNPKRQSAGVQLQKQGLDSPVSTSVINSLPTTSARTESVQTTPIPTGTAQTSPTQEGTVQEIPTQTRQAPVEPIPDMTILSQKTTDELKVLLTRLEHKNGVTKSSGTVSLSDNAYIKAVKETLREKLTAKYDARMNALDNLSLRQLSDLKNQIGKETVLSEDKKETYQKEINSRLYQAEENDLTQQIEQSKNKTYSEIEQIIEDVENRDIPDELKQDTLKKLMQIKADRAKREVEHLLTHMPLHLDRKQLSAYLDKVEQYKDVDLTPYRKHIEQRKDTAEQEEISALVKRGGKKDRKALWNLYEKLQASDYKEENKAPFLDKIYDQIQVMDEAAIEKICPSITNLSFADGLKAYEQISEGMFLPELKTNTLEMIKRRLTKLKTDESVQLMRKLKHDMEEKMTDCKGFYFYNAREELKIAQSAQIRSRMSEDEAEKENDDNNEEDNRSAMLRAINGYAAARNTYEYPLMVCDTSRAANGKEGFVLTPDHIFYHTLLNSGVIRIEDIKAIQGGRRIFGKGIYIKDIGGNKEKLPNNVHPKDWNTFTNILNDFISYLQERPESRSIEYMAKEKHDVIHCYRCGYVYKGGPVCPKCGSKMNR